jgi:hypothetical protein
VNNATCFIFNGPCYVDKFNPTLITAIISLAAVDFKPLIPDDSGKWCGSCWYYYSFVRATAAVQPIMHIKISPTLFYYKVKVPRNRPEGPEGGRGITPPFLDLGTRRGWVVSTTPRPLYPRKRPCTHCTILLCKSFILYECSRATKNRQAGRSWISVAWTTSLLLITR